MEKRVLKSVFVVGGSKEELRDLEDKLKEKGAEGVMSNEASRLLELKFLAVYADYPEGKKDQAKVVYAYRSTDCKDTSKPRVLKLKTALRRVRSDYYFKGSKFLK